MSDRMLDALNRVCKWRRVFTGKMLGTKPDTDPLAVGMNDLQEARIIQRVEVTALVGLLIQKGLITGDEFNAAVEQEASQLNADYEKRFPGFTAGQDGITLDPKVAMATMKRENWAP